MPVRVANEDQRPDTPSPRRAADGGPPVVILSTQHVRDLNTSRILQTLRGSGPLSRAELAAMSGVRRGTIGAITKRLIELNILEERPSESGGKSGRPATPLWFGSRAALSGAISIRRDAVEAAVVNARGDVLAHQSVGLDADADADRIDRVIVDLFQQVATGFAEDMVKIGVSVPGVCDHTTGRVTACPQLPGLVGTHLSQALRQQTAIDVVVDDDSLGSALGEQWFGVGRGHASFVTVQTGFGIGAGIVIDDAIVRGSAGLSTEVGHTCIDQHGMRCACGLKGCWETVASLHWVRDHAVKRGIKNGARMTIAQLARLARSHDPSAVDLLAQYADNIAVGLANLTQTLCVCRFILQGDVLQGGEDLRQHIEAATRARVLEDRRADVTVELSQLADLAGVFGAAAIALASALPVRA